MSWNWNIEFTILLLSSFLIVFPLDSTCSSTESQLKSLRYVSQFGKHLKRVPRQTNYDQDEMCFDSFNIAEGEIIRVHDSEKLGAKFLNEADLGVGIKSREDCLKSCCRTRGCTVNIFEEKGNGSCYLFDCGPSGSRCVFTAVPKYTVGKLKRNFQPFPLYRSNQHESELSQLRSLDGADLLKSTFGLSNDPYSSPSRPFPSHFPNQQQTLQFKPEPALVLLPQQQQQQNLQNQQQLLDFRQPNYEVEQTLQRPGVNSAALLAPGAPLSTVAPSSGILGLVPLSDGQNKPQEPHQHQILLQQQQQQQQQPQQSLQQQPAQAQKQQQEPLPQVQQRRASCHNNQFQCKSSGECIAIYNRCDGVPQCSDGSDEAPELRCPFDPTAINYGPPPKPILQQRQDQNNLKQMDVSNNGYLLPGSPYQSQQQSNGGSGLNRPVQQQQQQTEDFRYAPAGALPPQQQQQQSFSPGNHNGGKSEFPPPTYQQQPQQSSAGQEGLKSFHHKDGGVMEDSYVNPAQRQRFGPYWKPNPVDYSTGELSQNGNGGYQMAPVQGNYPGANNGGYGGYNMPSNSYQQNQQGYLAAQQGNQQQQQYGLQYGGLQQQQQQGTNYQQQQPGSGLYNGGAAFGGPPPGGASTAKTLNATLATQQAPATLVSTTTTPSTASIGQDPKLGVYYKEISKLEIPQNLRSLTEQIEAFARETEHDTTSHRAGAGAYFAFMAGLVMSVAMAFLVGCRLRRVGYRRRGKNRLDPDYLVDGMYL